MQTSTLLKIGIAGMFVSVIAAFVPLIAALLFGDDSMSQWTSRHVNEADTTVLLMFFAAMILYAMIKMGQQKHLEETRKRPSGR